MDTGPNRLRAARGNLFDLPAGHAPWVEGTSRARCSTTRRDATRYAHNGCGPGARRDAQWPPCAGATRRSTAATWTAARAHGARRRAARARQQPVAGVVPRASTRCSRYYGKLGELTGGSFRADLIETHGDRQGHVTAVHQMTATRDGATRVSRGSILFTFLGDKITDLLELHSDLPGDDAFLVLDVLTDRATSGVATTPRVHDRGLPR